MVPHLVTTLTGPINELEARLLESMPAIERWFRLEWMEQTPPFYTSVDLRNAGFKLAPVDTNLFPRGFHNLTPQMLPLAVQAATAAIERLVPDARWVLLLPDSRQTGQHYWRSVRQLCRILAHTGAEVRLGDLHAVVADGAPAPAPREVDTDDGEPPIRLEPLVRTPRRLGLKDFDPALVVLNDDLSDDAPAVLEGLAEQPLVPPVHAGWTVRRKSLHADRYEDVAKRFAKLVGIDPWLITPMHARCGRVDFAEKIGLECIRSNVDALITKIRRKYKDYGILERPFVVVKADNGIDGAGVMTVRDSREVSAMAAVSRERMRVKEGQPSITQVIIQEGVPTSESVDGAWAEPVVHTIDRHVVGGFYRVHADRGPDENLKAPGWQSVPLAFAESPQLTRAGVKPGSAAPNRFYMYGVVGRLAMLAASYELDSTDPDEPDAR